MSEGAGGRTPVEARVVGHRRRRERRLVGRPAPEKVAVELEHPRGLEREPHPGRRLAAAAMEDASQPARRELEHPLARQAREARRRDHVDRIALPHREGLAGGERVDDRRDEVAEARVLHARQLASRAVRPHHAGDARDDRLSCALERHELARRLEHAVVVDRVRRRRLVRERLRAVEDPVGRHRHERRAPRIRSRGDRARDADVARPRCATVSVDAAEIVEDHRVDDRIRARLLDRGTRCRLVEEVRDDVPARRVGTRWKRAHDRGDLVVARRCHRDDVRADEARAAGNEDAHSSLADLLDADRPPLPV